MRAIQLAKAALYAGAKLLIARRGAPPERITLAGAFGAQIDPLYAMALGMIPDCALDCVASAGNAAGTGARIALLNRAARAEIEAVARSIDKVETAIEPDFQSLFVAAMAFPHKTDAFPNLALRIALPAANPAPNERPAPETRRAVLTGREQRFVVESVARPATRAAGPAFGVEIERPSWQRQSSPGFCEGVAP